MNEPMYFLLEKVEIHCQVSLPEGNKKKHHRFSEKKTPRYTVSFRSSIVRAFVESCKKQVVKPKTFY